MSEIPEHGREPVPGLPARLPPGEHMLWQGRPDLWRFAVHVLHVRKVAIYFILLLSMRVVETPGVVPHLKFLGLAGLGLTLLLVLSWLMVRSTLYTITNRRVVMRFGIAVPMSINLPFSRIEAVELRARGRGFGDVAIRPEMNRTFSYLIVWPHARPWRLSPLQPMLRCLPDAEAVAGLLGEALADAPAAAAVETPAAAPTPTGPKQRPFPLAPLLGAGALLAFSVLSVGWLQLTDNGPRQAAIDDAIASIALRFADRPDGSVAVIAADSGEVIDELAPGTNNFLRATLRGLGRDRRARQASPDDAFTLYRTGDGRLLLVDSVTSRQIDLLAFGSSNASAFAKYLPEPTSVQLTQAASITSAAALTTGHTNTSHQENSP